MGIILFIMAVFVVIFVVPFVREWPLSDILYPEHIQDVLSDQSLLGVYKNSIFVAVYCPL